MNLATTVRAHVAATDIESALAVVIAAWSQTRALVLAELADAIDAKDPTPAFTGDTEAWLAAAQTATTHRERGALLRSISQRSAGDVHRAIVVAQTWHDPRLSREILALLHALPISGRRSRDVWRGVLEVVHALRDARFLHHADRLIDGWNVGADTKQYLTNRLRDAIDGLVEPLLPTAETTELRALASELAQRSPVKEATEADLLAAIYETPDDDGPRLVYADWLQERGDPRGEAIARQFANKAVSAKLRKTLFGPLAPVLTGESEVRRGFVAKATTKFRNQRDVEQHGQLAAWATVEELVCTSGTVRYDQREWAQYIGPAMWNVRRAHRVHPKHLLAAAAPWRIEELAFYSPETKLDDFRAVLASPLVPKLAHVIVDSGLPVEWIPGTRWPLHLSYWGDSASREVGRRLELARETGLERVSVITTGVATHYVRGPEGAFIRQ